MEWKWSEEEGQFRQEVRDYLKAELPSGWGKEIFYDQDDDEQFRFAHEFTKRLSRKGWLVVSWSKEYGGQDWPFWKQVIFYEEMAYAGAPVVGINAVRYLGPTIMLYGTGEQKQLHLPGIASGEFIWCQGYSEPNSGSDLASLQTSAVEDGDDFLINGQKIWTSGAQHSEWIFMLARTDPAVPKHKGISYFLVDMKTPGVTVQPLIDMSGGHHFNQVFFDNVRVPRSGLLGEKNLGWYMATTTLSFERAGVEGPMHAKRLLENLLDYAKQTERNGRPLSKDPVIRQKLAQMSVEVDIARAIAYRVGTVINNKQVPGPESPALKVFRSELSQRLAQVGMELLGLYGQLRPGSKWAPLKGQIENQYLTSISGTIAAGTSEIQRNIIAERGLSLPR
ncbi:MAG: acyl-CoA dehydrogenase family protein [Candidatus Entotheonellia bacterium]